MRRHIFQKLVPAIALTFAGCLAALGAEETVAGEEPSRNPRVPAVSLSPWAGMAYGVARELVYSKSMLLSELDWDMKPLVSAGIRGDLAWSAGLRLGAEFSAALPMASGIMEDSDFLNVKKTGSTAKTHFSRHDAVIEFAYDCKAEAGWEFALPVRGPWSRRAISVTPLVGIRYQTVKWNGNDGYTQYEEPPDDPGTDDVWTEWSESTAKTYLSGTVISYRQETWMPYASIAVTVPIGERFAVVPSFAWSPFAFWNDLDEHWETIYDFYDIISGGFMIEPACRVEFALAPGKTVFADGTWTWISGLRGDTYNNIRGTSGYSVSLASSGGGCGAEFNRLGFRLGFRFLL